jgi:hypothetical protein
VREFRILCPEIVRAVFDVIINTFHASVILMKAIIHSAYRAVFNIIQILFPQIHTYDLKDLKKS